MSFKSQPYIFNSIPDVDKQILAWCYNNNKTYIDGSKIYTGTINADKINVNNLSSISANLGTVTAGTIKGTTIEGATIKGGTISSGTTINVATDLNVGNNIYLGSQDTSGLTTKYLYFTPTAYIERLTFTGGTEKLEVHSGSRLSLRADYNAVTSDIFALIGITALSGGSSISFNADSILANGYEVATMNKVSPIGGSTSNGGAVVVYDKGASLKPSFSVPNIDQYKYFLVRVGNATTGWATWIFVPYQPDTLPSSFRGIGGFETENATYGGEFYFLRGTVTRSGVNGTVNIDSCWLRRTYNIQTNGSSIQCYIHKVIGVK